MQIKHASVSDLFSWLMASFQMVGANLRVFMFASLLSVCVIIAFCVFFGLGFFGLIGGNPTALLTGEGIQSLLIMYGIAIVVGVLIMPPFMAGWLKLCQKLANGQPAESSEIFQLYSDKTTWIKLVVFCLLGMVLNIAVLAIFIMAFGAAGLGQDMQTFMMAQMGGDPNAMMSLPSSFWLAYVGIIFISNFMQLIFMLGFCQISLKQGEAIDSLKIAIAAVMKNFVSLLIFTIVAFFAILVATFLFGLILALAIAVLAFIHESLAVIAGVILYAVLLLSIYPIMFSFVYLLWKGLLGDDSSAQENTPLEAHF